MTSREPNFFQNLQAELSTGRLWLDRGIVLLYAAVAGLMVVAFTLLSDWTFALFQQIHGYNAGLCWCGCRP